MNQLSLLSDIRNPIWMADMHREEFTDEFLAYLPDNLHVFEAFVAEVRKVKARGFKHYSARTIVEVLRHHSALAETGGAYKLNDWHTPYLARLCALCHPAIAQGMFEFRRTKATERGVAA